MIPGEIVAVVVTHLGQGDLLDACLDALDRAGGVRRCVVVDNSSPTTSHDPVSLSWPSMAVHLLPTANRGFGAAANCGFEHARRLVSDLERAVFVLLNDDVEVSAGWLDPLLAEFGDDSVGAVQPMLVFAATDTVNSLGVVVGGDGAGTDDGLGQRVDDVERAPREIQAFTGGAVAFRPAFLEATGGFDERYFLYYEDVDLARRGARLGWSYRCVPDSVVMHRKGASTDSLGERLVVPARAQPVVVGVPERVVVDGARRSVVVDATAPPPAAPRPRSGAGGRSRRGNVAVGRAARARRRR